MRVAPGGLGPPLLDLGVGTMYDAIVVGARCAGSPTAMLLARRGYRVLLVDRATFPSDTLSTHFIHLSGTALLEQWGLLDTVRASGCPTLRELVFDIGPLRLVGPPPPLKRAPSCGRASPWASSSKRMGASWGSPAAKREASR